MDYKPARRFPYQGLKGGRPDCHHKPLACKSTDLQSAESNFWQTGADEVRCSDSVIGSTTQSVLTATATAISVEYVLSAFRIYWICWARFWESYQGRREEGAQEWVIHMQLSSWGWDLLRWRSLEGVWKIVFSIYLLS